jgi:hypothetical protein
MCYNIINYFTQQGVHPVSVCHYVTNGNSIRRHQGGDARTAPG